jgi:hypothetical protein
MTHWDVYADIGGFPVYASFEVDDSLTEDEAFEEIVDEFRSTLQIDRM